MIYDTKVGMADLSASSFFSLTQAEYAAGINASVLHIKVFLMFNCEFVQETFAAKFWRVI